MNSSSRFYNQQGELDQDLVEIWAETFFHDMMNMINGFYVRVEMDEVLNRMREMPFQNLAAQQLEGQASEVIELALVFVDAIAAREIEYLQAYLGKLQDL